MVSERIQRRIDRLLDEADEAFGRYDWEAVRQGAEAVIRLDPNNADALTFLDAANRDLASAPRAGTRPDAPVPEQREDPGQVAPTSFANGRYEVKDLLGEGGRKRVYQAHDTVLDRDVALAVIKTEGLDPTSRVRITREAWAASATTHMSCPFTILGRTTASLIWCCRLCPAGHRQPT